MKKLAILFSIFFLTILASNVKAQDCKGYLGECTDNQTSAKVHVYGFVISHNLETDCYKVLIVITNDGSNGETVVGWGTTTICPNSGNRTITSEGECKSDNFDEKLENSCIRELLQNMRLSD